MLRNYSTSRFGSGTWKWKVNRHLCDHTCANLCTCANYRTHAVLLSKRTVYYIQVAMPVKYKGIKIMFGIYTHCQQIDFLK